MQSELMVEVNDLVVRYRRPGGRPFEAVKAVSFDVRRGEFFGIVGESGCGKSSLAKAIVGLNPIASGSLKVHSDKRVQMIFQDAAGSLNPRKTIRSTLAEVLKVYRKVEHTPEAYNKRIAELLDYVGLPLDIIDAYPRELSGGQCQRISIARCLAMDPEILIADEPVSALDVSVQARVLNLLVELRERLQLTIILISHDLAVVRTVCDRVVVMQDGVFVERGTASELFDNPQHPYTQHLLAAVPDVYLALKERKAL